LGANYSFVLENENGPRTVKVTRVSSLEHALFVVRKKYSFKEWRVINVAETYIPQEKPKKGGN